MSAQWAVRSVQLALVAVLFGCASSAPPVQPPAWTQVPSVVLDALCSTLQNEGLSPDNILIVRTTQPLVSGASLRSVGHAYGKDAEVGTLAQAINAAASPIPLAVTEARCAWKPVAKLDPLSHVDRMVVEISAPILNPFVRSEAGLMARMSIGGHDSQWYWIPLGHRTGEWAIGIVLPMDMHE
jgi:hypothetical protein